MKRCHHEHHTMQSSSFRTAFSARPTNCQFKNMRSAKDTEDRMADTALYAAVSAFFIAFFAVILAFVFLSHILTIMMAVVILLVVIAVKEIILQMLRLKERKYQKQTKTTKCMSL